jgi:secondary thiamine-phosphate synthase enzyme
MHKKIFIRGRFLQSNMGARILKIETHSKLDFINITGMVRDAVKHSGVKDGIAIVFCRHTTAAIVINEYEKLLLKDIEAFLGKAIPEFGEYRHDDMDRRECIPPDEPPNAPSHIKSVMLSAQQSMPISEGEIMLGTWQSIIFIELDGPRRREIAVQVIGK